MDQITRLAFLTVARACGFAMLAVCCLMIAYSFDPKLSFKVGGVLTLLLTVVLMIKGLRARQLDHRRTELWLYLDKAARPKEPVARILVGSALREAYFTFARRSAACAVFLLSGSVALGLFTA